MISESNWYIAPAKVKGFLYGVYSCAGPTHQKPRPRRLSTHVVCHQLYFKKVSKMTQNSKACDRVKVSDMSLDSLPLHQNNAAETKSLARN